MKKCPPGVICIENLTMGFIIVMLAIIFIYVMNHVTTTSPRSAKQSIIVNNERREVLPRPPMIGGTFMRPNIGYTNLPNDVYMNPYTPPLRDERYLVPINVPTNIGAVDSNYRQVGMLTPLHGSSKNKILPLMGRPLIVTRDKWQYYAISNQNNSIKLPIIHNGKDCTTEYGVNELYSRDVVYVEGHDEAFKIKMYENDNIRYLPSFL